MKSLVTRFRWAAIVGCCPLCWAWCAIAEGQLPELAGFGSRSIALGGAVSASVEDVSASFYNPAGLVRDDVFRLSVGYFRVVPSLTVNGRSSEVDSFGGVTYGLVIPGEVAGVPFAVGVAGHLPDAYLGRARTVPRQTPRWFLYDNRPQRLFTAAGLAVRPLPWLAVGFGAAFLASNRNELSVRGSLDLNQAERDSRLEHQLQADLGTQRFPQGGIQLTVNPQWSFGLVYRGESKVESTLIANVDASIDELRDSRVLLDVESVSVSTFVPQQVSLGASWTPTARWGLSLEFTWVNWGRFVSPLGSIQADVNAQLPEGSDEFVTVPESIPLTLPEPADFSDQLVPRLGAEYKAVLRTDYDIAVRGGYVFENSPAPEQRGISNLIDSDRHTFSFGAGFRLHDLRPYVPGFLNVDIHMTFSWLPERINQQDSLVGPFTDFASQGTMWGVGVTTEVGFE